MRKGEIVITLPKKSTNNRNPTEKRWRGASKRAGVPHSTLAAATVFLGQNVAQAVVLVACGVPECTEELLLFSTPPSISFQSGFDYWLIFSEE
jgi:hypothetical protein